MLVKPDFQPLAKIKLVGVGGAGNNAVNTMISDYDIQGVEFYAVNTDAQVLKNSLANTIAIGEELTRGLGVGGNPEVGEQAAEESIDLLHEHLAGADMVFVTAGMGGGTGTGAAPVVASVAKGHGALTVAVVTKPFLFEGKKRSEIALDGVEALRDNVDTLIVVPNQRILDLVEENVSFLDAMKKSDDVLAQGVRSIASLVTQTGFINVDFADVKSVMSDAGTSMMGMGSATGSNRAIEATKQAINSPLLEMSVDGATGVLINVIGGKGMSMKEVQEAGEMIHDVVDPDATIIFGATVDENLEDELQVTVLATGFDDAGPSTAGYTSPVRTTAAASVGTKKPSRDRDDADMGEDRGPRIMSSSDAGTAASMVGSMPSKPKKKDHHDDKGGDDLFTDEDELDVPAFMRKK